MATAYRWAADGVDQTESAWEWPTVDLTWSCRSSDYKSDDVIAVAYPPNAYRLKVKDLHGQLTWDQELFVRPDFNAGRMVVQMRGQPGVARVVELSEIGTTGKYAWDLDLMGFDADGWVKEIGNPVGSKLRLFIDDGTFRTKTWNDETYDLLKVP